MLQKNTNQSSHNLAIDIAKNDKKSAAHGVCFLNIKKNNHVENIDNSEMKKSLIAQLKDTDFLSGTALEEFINHTRLCIARKMSNNENNNA